MLPDYFSIYTAMESDILPNSCTSEKNSINFNYVPIYLLLELQVN